MSIFSATPPSHRRIFLAGSVLLAVQAAALLVLLAMAPAWAARVCGTIAATSVGGLAGAIVAGLELGLTPWQVVGVLAAFSVMHLCLGFPIITTLYHRAMEVKVLGRWVSATRVAAERQKDMVTRLGSFGLPVFVWLPFPWTGALVGAVIGYMVGMRTRRIMLVAIPAMLLSVVMWVSAVSQMRVFGPFRGWPLLVAVLVLLGGFTAIRAVMGRRCNGGE